jgi:hypothetical protein
VREAVADLLTGLGIAYELPSDDNDNNDDLRPSSSGNPGNPGNGNPGNGNPGNGNPGNSGRLRVPARELARYLSVRRHQRDRGDFVQSSVWRYCWWGSGTMGQGQGMLAGYLAAV